VKVLKNYLYNLSYQLLVIVLPVITTPYITRVFSSNDLGSYGYYNSIVTYFILLATLGVANYGTKEISGHRKEVEKTFWGIYSLQVLSTCLAVTLYIVVCLLVPSMNNPIAYILGFSLLSRGFDISWLFQGLEDFKKITARNTMVKLLGVVSIFLFVKKPSDLYLYIILLVAYDLLGQLSMWLPAREHIRKPHLDIAYAKEHIKPVILLLLPQIAISLYITLDRTMLGALSSTKDVGIYDQALKLLNIFELKERHPQALSGGQKQRVTIAAAIASNKRVIVFDEPTSGLDYNNMKAVSEAINTIRKNKVMNFVISHDLEFLSRVTTKAVFIEEGKVSKTIPIKNNEDFELIKRFLLQREVERYA